MGDFLTLFLSVCLLTSCNEVSVCVLLDAVSWDILFLFSTPTIACYLQGAC